MWLERFLREKVALVVNCHRWLPILVALHREVVSFWASFLRQGKGASGSFETESWLPSWGRGRGAPGKLKSVVGAAIEVWKIRRGSCKGN
jgi:hypothetical protein